jgi:mannose-6-phosphate isomerase-like protein (cupin superfamily)
MPVLFSRPRSAKAGATLDFETLTPDSAPLRMREAEATLLRVIAGEVRLVVEGAERLLAVGEEAIVPAGARHRLSAVGREARVVLGFSPR